MARVKRKKNPIIENLDAILNGKTDVPIIASGHGEKREILEKIEYIRQNMVAAERSMEIVRQKGRIAAAALAHDLKTPLALIAGYAECLKEGMDDKDYLSLILDKTQAMNNTVLTLVEDAINADNPNARTRVEINAREFFTKQFKKFANLAESKSIKFKLRRFPRVLLFVDVNRIERVIQNLITNAVKFTSAGGRITIDGYVNRGRLNVTVTDTGIGIAKENLDNVFDKFFKEDASRPIESSSGLGLHIAKEFINEHGGKIWAKSKKNKGTTITFTLPVLDKFSAAKPRAAANSSQQNCAAANRNVANPLPPCQMQKKRSNFWYTQTGSDFCDQFERLPRIVKLVVLPLSFGAISAIYRLAKFFSTRQLSTFIAAIAAIPLFPFFLVLDFLCELTDNRILFCAE